MEKHDTILVTGAGGLVGSHVVDLLKEQGFSDVLGPGKHVLDYLDGGAVATYLAVKKPRHVIHCAARVYGIMGNMRNQAQSILENTAINTNVIEASRRAGVEKITAMGTGAIYPTLPDGRDVYFTSDIWEGRPHPSEAGYAHAKRHMLATLEAYRDSYGMDFAYVVSCNLFGPRDKFDTEGGHVVPSLVKKFFDAKRSGGGVIVWGDGSATRDFLYVKDAARVVTLVANQVSGPINMGSDSVWSIKEIVRVLTKISGLPPEQVAWDYTKPNGQAHRAYDLTALNDLGFERHWSVAKGLQETWEWYCHEGQELLAR